MTNAEALALLATNIRAKSPATGIKAETVSTLIVKPEAFMRRLIFLTFLDGHFH
jgi:hypothetical protein